MSARLREPFFRARPAQELPGREQFGSDYAARFLEACRKAGGSRGRYDRNGNRADRTERWAGLFQLPAQEDAAQRRWILLSPAAARAT